MPATAKAAVGFGDQPALRVRKATKKSAALQLVANHPVEYTDCRVLGHAWQHRGNPYDESSDGFWRSLPDTLEHGSVGLVSICAHCGTTRTKFLTRSGIIGLTRYRYPDGYQTHGEHVSPLDWRKAFVVQRFG